MIKSYHSWLWYDYGMNTWVQHYWIVLMYFLFMCLHLVKNWYGRTTVCQDPALIESWGQCWTTPFLSHNPIQGKSTYLHGLICLSGEETWIFLLMAFGIEKTLARILRPLLKEHWTPINEVRWVVSAGVLRFSEQIPLVFDTRPPKYTLSFMHSFIKILYMYTYIYMSPVPGPPHPPPPPPMVSPPTPNPPHPPQNLVFACYLHIYIHIYTYILPFPPLQPRISTLFAALESHDLVNGPCLPVYFYHNLFFRTAYSVPRTWFTTYLLPMDYAKLTYANLDICTVEKQ